VKDFGVGLICIGGDQSFTAGGYRGTPLETMLPVSMELESKKVLPSGAVVLVMHWAGNVFDKNREFGFLIDDRADAAQRDALKKIFTGKAGGTFAAWAALTISLDGVRFVPMRVTHDAESWRVEVPGLVDGEGGPYRKYMVPEGDTCRIYNAPRPEVVPGHITLGHAKKNRVTGPFGRNWDLAGRSAKHIAFDLRGPETFTWKKPLRQQ
jgi:hypothetical protein